MFLAKRKKKKKQEKNESIVAGRRLYGVAI